MYKVLGFSCSKQIKAAVCCDEATAKKTKLAKGLLFVNLTTINGRWHWNCGCAKLTS